jgi:hypothetical protein
MKNEEPSLDELILGLPSVHDLHIKYRQELYGAFDVTEQGLLTLESHLHDVASTITQGNMVQETVIVLFSGKPTEKYNSISEVLTLRNPRIGRITGINIRMSAKEGLASIYFDEIGLYSSHSIVLLFAARSDINLSKHEALIKDELANLECWYSPIRKCSDRIVRLMGKVPYVLYTALFFIGLVSIIFSFYSDRAKHTQWRTDFEKFLRAYESLSVKKPELDPNIVEKINEIKTILVQYDSPGVLKLIIRIIYVLAAGFILLSCIIFAAYLFPRIVFEIGEGRIRQEQRVWLRRFVIGSIIVCGIIIPLLFKKLI